MDARGNPQDGPCGVRRLGASGGVGRGAWLRRDKEEKERQEELERQERRLARERRRKENELKALRDEIKKNFIKKGEIKDNMISWDLLDVNGNYEKGKTFAGALGGQLLQFCIVLEALSELSGQQPGGEKK
jgi:hypothetical protein